MMNRTVDTGITCGSGTYVGIITVGRASQPAKAPYDMLTREVGRDKLVRAELARRESYKRTREVISKQSMQIDT